MVRFRFDWDFFFGGIANIGIAMIAAANVAVFLNEKSPTGLFLYGTLIFILGYIGKSIKD